MNNSKNRPVTGRNLAKLSSLPELLVSIQSQLEGLSDARLFELAVSAGRLEWCAFVIRGMCVYELRQRCAKRLPGGRGKRDQMGVGIQARLARLATEIGVAKATLLTDGRIYETFFRLNAGDNDQRLLDRDKCLPREFYVMALSTHDPRSVIAAALAKRDVGGYSLESFRADLQIESKATKAVAPKADSINVSISPEAKYALSEIAKVTNATQGEIVSDALVALYQIRFPPSINLLDVESISGD